MNIKNIAYIAVAVIVLGGLAFVILNSEKNTLDSQEPTLINLNQQQKTNNQLMDTKEQGTEFLEANAKRDEVSTTESGLQYEVLESVAEGESPVLTSVVNVHYHGTTIDGEVFDSSVDRGEPISFPLGAVIEGWQEGLQLMKVGEKYKFFIPSDLAYGDYSPSAAIPAGSTLIFEVELLGIQ